MKPLELVADLFLLAAFVLTIIACATISTPLALGAAALMCFAFGVLLTALAIRKPKPPTIDRGPFEPGT